MSAGKFKGFLLLSDIDGTLTTDDGKISDENAAAIRRFQSEGGLFTVASGRYPMYIAQYADRFVPNTYIIGTNGTELYDPMTKETVFTRRFRDTDDVKQLIRTVCADPLTTGVAISTYREERWVGQSEFAQLDEIFDALPPLWHRLIFVHETPEDTVLNMQKMIALCGERYAIDRSFATGIEVHESDSGKGAVIPLMRQMLAQNGTLIHTVVCVGDYENDMTMLQYADLAYAVENAIPELKAIADRITVHHNDSAIAAIIADIEDSL